MEAAPAQRHAVERRQQKQGRHQGHLRKVRAGLASAAAKGNGKHRSGLADERSLKMD
jgi:hypothetical protein